jgi:hypothetical protein
MVIHKDAWFTFRFADDRIIPRFHLDGLAAGTRVTIYRIDTVTEERREQLATAVVGADGWVELAEPLRVRAGDAFIAEPGPTAEITSRPASRPR